MRRMYCVAGLCLSLFIVSVTVAVSVGASASQTATSALSSLVPVGREVAVPTHLRDGQEFSLPMTALLVHGKLLFEANWTDQEGGGRPLTKGTGRPLADVTQPLTGVRAFNRLSAPDANSCR